jgi:two-component system chemotaxis response regulator CheY
MPVSVLVVESDVEIRNAVQTLLEREGYEVNCADDSDEALELLKGLPRPCIVLWDALTSRQSLSMLDEATLEGVHVATLPISLIRLATADPADLKFVKRVTSEDAILSVVREHCPLAEAANA